MINESGICFSFHIFIHFYLQNKTLTQKEHGGQNYTRKRLFYQKRQFQFSKVFKPISVLQYLECVGPGNRRWLITQLFVCQKAMAFLLFLCPQLLAKDFFN